jgi:LuxR family glucitol operon transcriptional activator
LLTEVARQFEPGEDSPLVRVRRLLDENKILLVIDNLETVLDQTLRDFALDVPGESKLVFTSRVPLGSDLSVHVGDFDEREARTYLSRLIEAYKIIPLQKKTNTQLDHYARKLNRKPLLLKWFALGVLSGLDPDVITANIDLALKFCMENVIDRLSANAKKVASALAALPGAASAALIQEVVDLTSDAAEAAIAELLRSALIQRDDKAKMERVYQLGMFTKIYITRVLKPDSTFSNAVLSRYRAIEAVYQAERGSQAFNRYDSRIFTVRNRSGVGFAKTEGSHGSRKSRRSCWGRSTPAGDQGCQLRLFRGPSCRRAHCN